MSDGLLLWFLILIPAFGGGVCVLMPSIKTAFAVMCTCVFSLSFLGVFAINTVFMQQGTILFAASRWLFMDALSAYNLFVMLIIFCLSSVYACVYFAEELRGKHLTLKQVRTFACLWCEALAAMMVVLLSNNLGIMWVGMEATTLITAFLICVHVSRESLEAMWKYILICSVGVAFAFLGTLLVAASAKGLALGAHDALLWTTIRSHTSELDPVLIRAAFIFLLVGYGTKAGLAPMHSWLPDAHSQAPSPVSAIFSGFLLSTSMYCIMRYIPILENSSGNTGWSLKLLTGFGLFSITIASAFILFQDNLKRFLAYSSMEHIGIIALGLGLGGLGTFAALFHTLNHSIAKILSFFAAGRLGQMLGSHNMKEMNGMLRVSPAWGTGIFFGLLALIGIAPFALFMSEFYILKSAIDSGSVFVVVVFLLGVGVVFVGALGHAIPLAWGTPHESFRPLKTTFVECVLVVFPLAVLLALGLWMPDVLQTALNAAADIIRTTGSVTYISAGVIQ